MSLIRLLICFCVCMSATKLFAQKDSVWQTLTRPVSKTAKKLDQATDKLTTTLDSTASVITTTTDKYADKATGTINRVERKADSVIARIEDIPARYIKQVDTKISKYSSRITGKTEKTLAKLAKWENKIKAILEKASPQTAEQLFGEGKTTFGTLLAKIKEGQSIAGSYKAKYDEYRDKLNTSLKYISSKKNELESKYAKPVTEAADKAKKLEGDVANSEALEKFIKERKKQLMDECVKYIGNSKYLKKINKESYYYVETIRNYKEIFSDPSKTEETVKTILNKIPAFKKFFSENSMLASIFGSNTGTGGQRSIEGLQTRDAVTAMLQSRIGGSGVNTKELFGQGMNQAQNELQKLKQQAQNLAGGGSQNPDNIKGVNKEKTKTFRQRLEYELNYEFAKNNTYLPMLVNISVSVGYKLNPRSVIGLGATYKMGLGTIEKIRFTTEGLGLKAYMDWKLRKQFYITGGYEANHFSGFSNTPIFGSLNEWQQSGLLGISRKIPVKTKFTKGAKIQVLYDFLYMKHNPVSKPWIFRIGYNF